MKHLYTILLGCAVLLGPVSCMKIDNFDAPSAKIQGKIIDKTTGQPMLLDQGVSHIRIWEMYNDKLFSGTYDMLPRDGAWWPCDTTYNVAIGKAGTVQDFEVIPYLHVVDFDATLDGTELTMTCRLQAPVTDGLPQIREIRPFINNNIHCGPGNHIDYYYNDANRINLRKMWPAIGDADGNQTVAPYSLKIQLKAGYTYWVRMGVQVNDTYTSWNLSEVKKIVVPE